MILVGFGIKRKIQVTMWLTMKVFFLVELSYFLPFMISHIDRIYNDDTKIKLFNKNLIIINFRLSFLTFMGSLKIKKSFTPLMSNIFNEF